MSLQTPLPTAHAVERWEARTGDDAGDLGEAWTASQRIRAAAHHCGDEVRYHHGQDVALVRQGGTLVTVRPRGDDPLWTTIDEHLDQEDHS